MRKVSVIIPSYEPDYYIWECLNSVYNQSLGKELYEVIIVLNGNKEPFYTDILNYVKDNNLDNFRLIYTDGKGVSNARNIGLENSNGEYIVFLDDDDFIDKDYLLLCLDALENDNNYDNIIISVESQNFLNEINTNNDNSLVKIQKKDYSIFKKRSVFSAVCCTMLPKILIEDVKFKTEYKNSEDSLFMMEISKNIGGVRCIEGKVLHHRRVRNNSASFRKMSIKYIIVNNFKMFKEYIKLLSNKGYNKKFILLRMLAITKGAYVQIMKNK